MPGTCSLHTLLRTQFSEAYSASTQTHASPSHRHSLAVRACGLLIFPHPHFRVRTPCVCAMRGCLCSNTHAADSSPPPSPPPHTHTHPPNRCMIWSPYCWSLWASPLACSPASCLSLPTNGTWSAGRVRIARPRSGRCGRQARDKRYD